MKLVAKLRTHAEIDKEKLDALMKELFDAHSRGEIREILFAYVDDKGTSNYAMSGSMTLSNFAYLLAVLQWKLNRWLDKD